MKVFLKSCSVDSRNDPNCEVLHETKLTLEVSWTTCTCLAHVHEFNSDQSLFPPNMCRATDSGSPGRSGKVGVFFPAAIVLCYEVTEFTETRPLVVREQKDAKVVGFVLT